MKITEHFAFEEFLRGTNLKYNDLQARTKSMVLYMANTLELIRSTVGQPILITNGIRDIECFNRLKSKGLNPSTTSDHFYSENPLNPLGVGAVDIICPNMDTKIFFTVILQLKYEKAIKTGQLLLERHNSWWVHLANDPRCILTPEQLAKRSWNSINLVAWSKDNGKTFNPIAEGQHIPENLP